MAYCPANVASPLKWTQEDPMTMLPMVTNSPWAIVDKNKSNNKYASNLKDITNQYFISAKGTIPVEIKSGIKRKREEESSEGEDNDFQQTGAKKKLKSTPFQIDALKGLIWDAENYSCAYDALYTIYSLTFGNLIHLNGIPY